jgi:hypothetical protein
MIHHSGRGHKQAESDRGLSGRRGCPAPGLQSLPVLVLLNNSQISHLGPLNGQYR